MINCKITVKRGSKIEEKTLSSLALTLRARTVIKMDYFTYGTTTTLNIIISDGTETEMEFNEKKSLKKVLREYFDAHQRVTVYHLDKVAYLRICEIEDFLSGGLVKLG